VLIESTPGAKRPNAGAHAFRWRLADNFFRRFGWFIVPVIATTALGVAQARDTLELYRSTATLSAASNPLLPTQSISGVNAQFWETPAGVTTRIINERLRTNSFLDAVAESAGLGPAIESGLLDLNVVRESIWASATGDSILSVNAQWNDPQVSYNLVAATIDEYENFLTETVASDSSQAEEFYSAQLDRLRAERGLEEQALTDFVARLPVLEDGESYPINVDLEIERLRARVDAVQGKIATAEAELDKAHLLRAQETVEAGRSFNVIDQPEVPGAPESTMMKQAMLLASFFMLGVVISGGALLLTTVFDQSVASSADLLPITGVTLVATVPPVVLANARSQNRVFRRVRGPAGMRRTRIT
jgi:uncharacterized protein involved in exopolysaccharide biosynthesis